MRALPLLAPCMELIVLTALLRQPPCRAAPIDGAEARRKHGQHSQERRVWPELRCMRASASTCEKRERGALPRPPTINELQRTNFVQMSKTQQVRQQPAGGRYRSGSAVVVGVSIGPLQAWTPSFLMTSELLPPQ